MFHLTQTDSLEPEVESHMLVPLAILTAMFIVLALCAGAR